MFLFPMKYFSSNNHFFQLMFLLLSLVQKGPPTPVNGFPMVIHLASLLNSFPPKLVPLVKKELNKQTTTPPKEVDESDVILFLS